jgi:predicted acetylornithine/succinylornithine family transaminase
MTDEQRTEATDTVSASDQTASASNLTVSVLNQYERYVIGNYGRTPLVVDRAEGSYFWDLDGKRYLDLFPGWGCSAVGHCHPKVVAAIREQVGRLVHMDNTFYTVAQGRLAEMLGERSFGGQSYFCNSGAEATEAAIKIARRATPAGRYKVITMEKSFHGRTYGAMSATAQSKTHAGNEPLLAGFTYVPFDDVEAVAAAIDDETAAVLVEPIQGEGGVRVPSDDYLAGLRDLCDGTNVVLIFDEVQTGCGRTGRWFGYQHWDVEPDVMTLGKALGGGAPIAAILAREEVAAALTPGSHATTYGANPLVVSAAIGMIDAVESENLLDNAARMGDYLRERLPTIEPEPGVFQEIRGKGLMLAVELTVPGSGVVAKCLDAGLRVNCTQDTVLRMLPAMNITREQIDEGLEILGRALADVTHEAVTS